MTVTSNPAHLDPVTALQEAQQRLPRLLIAGVPDQQAIAEAAELVRRLEIRALTLERREAGRR